jgi:hypothetical protein
VLVLAGVGLAWAGVRIFSGYPHPPAPLQVLARREYATLAASALAMFPQGGAVPPSGVDAGIPEFVDRYLVTSSPRIRRLMRLLFFLIEHASLFFPAGGRGGLRRFSALSFEQQSAYLQSWERSRLYPRRIVFLSLRAILSMGYFADPAVLQALGLAPRAIETPVCEADLLWPRIGESPESLRPTRDDVTPPSDGTPLGTHGPIHPDYEVSRP